VGVVAGFLCFSASISCGRISKPKPRAFMKKASARSRQTRAAPDNTGTYGLCSFALARVLLRISRNI
jgi:hypothetical protein